MQGFSPNAPMDPAFAQKLKEASQAGVEIIAYKCSITTDEVKSLRKFQLKYKP